MKGSREGRIEVQDCGGYWRADAHINSTVRCSLTLGNGCGATLAALLLEAVTAGLLTVDEVEAMLVLARQGRKAGGS